MDCWRGALQTARHARDTGDLVAAEVSYRLAAQHAARSDPTGAGRALAFTRLAELFANSNRSVEAEYYYGRALKSWRQAYEADHPHIVSTTAHLLRTIGPTANRRRILRLTRKLICILRDLRGFRGPLCVIETSEAPPDAEGREWERAVHFVPEPAVLATFIQCPYAGSHLGALARYYCSRGWFLFADQMFRHAIRLSHEAGEEYAIPMGADLDAYSAFLRRFGRREDPMELAKQAQRIRRC